MSTHDLLEPLRGTLSALDGIQIAACALDHGDRALLWNRTFLQFFPEHAGQIHSGEPYSDNLRRFYQGRLQGSEREALERYVAEGLQRHREQTQPFSFEHHGRRLVVSAQDIGALGRLRVWRSDREPGAAVPLRAGTPSPTDLELVADGVMVADAASRIGWVNEAFVVLYGLHDRAAAVGQCFEDIYRAAWQSVPAGEQAPLQAGLALLNERMRFAGAPFELPLPGSRWCRVVEQRRPDGQRVFVHADITALKRQQQHLADAERRARDSEGQLARKSALLEATLERMEQGVMMVNAEHVVEVCNRRAIQLLGLPEALMATRPKFEEVLAFQWSQGEFSRTPADLQRFVRAGGILERAHVYERQRPDGSVLEVQSVPIEGGGVLRTITDITERKRAEERIRHVARHDGLTALVTREVFLEHLAGAVDSPERRLEGFAVHYIDLDRFKEINDRHGHAIGDKVLAIAAGRMRKVAREADIVARMGGDEFAILQFGVTQVDDSLHLAQRLLTALALPMDVEQRDLRVGASIGIALSRHAGGDARPDTLLRLADAAMYRAKASGRDAVRVHGWADGPDDA